ncbi:integrin beta-7 [Lampris incognitus]|uniref:integrin beta-7 n=1 Tax=Lampris incognitus TaxID=2546036 RepID=UPI0024B57992|nr:integrin beta-7 [Lampris incognitus]
MTGVILLATVLLHVVGRSETQEDQRCVPKPTCAECLQSPGCMWCKQKDFLKAGESNARRCDSEESLTGRRCEERHLVYPRVEVVALKNNDLSDRAGSVVQLKPQNVKVKLRVGVPQVFTVSFKRAEGYPIDLYYLMDLSYSMKDDLGRIKNLGHDIVRTLGTFTKNIRIGFGSFVDKVALPYVSLVKAKRRNPCPSRIDTCQPAFSFQNILRLTENANDFKKEVSRQRISGNLDSPEAGFDAIMQAAVCQDVIGWNNVTRILVYTSDDTFHMAGDGRLAGIFEPHDGQCHLSGTGFYDGTKFDYPSVGHLARVLTANNIQLIFAVTEDILPAYQALSMLIPQSVVGVLQTDSSNVVQLISEAYNNLSSTIFLEHQGAPQNLQVSYQSHCTSSQAGTAWKQRGECMNVRINQQVDFTVRLNISECLTEPQVFYIKVQGISESLKINVETLCDCNCQDREESSTHCNNRGTLYCGICSCDAGAMGQRCNCVQTEGVDSMDRRCHQENSSLPCSGHGSCECGKCTCSGTYVGHFCDCDNHSCAKHNNVLCGGNGECNCGRCVCNANYTGPVCGCSALTDQCRTEDNSICSGHGKCQCNQCKCNQLFTGKHCSAILNACSNYKDCMHCTSQQENGDMKNCSVPCGSAKVHRMNELKDLPCNTPAFMYEVKPLPDGTILITYTDQPRSIDKTYMIILSSVSAIIFIGLLGIIVSRLLLELHYRREYRSFVKSQKQAVWDDTPNPLFRDAVTTTMNPMHISDD